MLQSELPMIREACLRVLVLCTIFLMEAATYWLCLAEIGEMMSREFRSSEEKPSELEVICIEARKLTTEEMLSPNADTDSDEFQFYIDCEASGYDFTPKFSSEIFMAGTPFNFRFGTVNGRIPLSKLEESIEEEENEGKEEELEFISAPSLAKNPSIPKLLTSLKNIIIGDKKQKFPPFSGPKLDHGYLGSSSSSHKSANELVPGSVSFLKLSDMDNDECELYLPSGSPSLLVRSRYKGSELLASFEIKIQLLHECGISFEENRTTVLLHENLR